MAPKSRGAMRVLESITQSTKANNIHICLSCRNSIIRRNYASAAVAAEVSSESPAGLDSSNPPVTSTVLDPDVKVKAGIVVSRPPIVTPSTHPFESAYYLYQRRLNERLALPFMQYFYYKKGTPAFEAWRSHRRERGGVATRDIGDYNAYGKEGWNDEIVMSQEKLSKQEHLISELIKEEGRGTEYAGENASQEAIQMGGLRRTTEADKKKDERSLERSLDRTLYLLVKHRQKKSTGSKGKKPTPEKDDVKRHLWRFPRGDLTGKEGLKEAAQRILTLRCGPDMNTWFVAHHPVGHFIEPANLGSNDSTSTDTTSSSSNALINSTKTFYMKARILAGQAVIQKPQQQESQPETDVDEIEDFKWLSKDEVEKTVDLGYWLKIRNMLVEQ